MIGNYRVKTGPYEWGARSGSPSVFPPMTHLSLMHFESTLPPKGLQGPLPGPTATNQEPTKLALVRVGGFFSFLFLFCFVFLSMHGNLSNQGPRLRLRPLKGNPRGSGLLGSGERRSGGPRVNFLCPPMGALFPSTLWRRAGGWQGAPAVLCPRWH